MPFNALFSLDVGIGSRLMAGCTTGAMAVALAQPTDVVKVRFQAQISTGANKRYHGTMDAYRTIAKEEGFRGLWKGEPGPTWVIDDDDDDNNNYDDYK